MTDPNEDFISFEKALRELKMQSNELRKLVSEGEIRAFRDGDSMKFKREDLDTIAGVEELEELDFADTLEDDAGMVTEEISEEDTLLADDVDEDVSAAPAAARGGARARSGGSASRAPRARAEEAVAETEPVWVTGVAIVSSVVLLYGLMVSYSIAVGGSPGGLTGIFG